MTRMIHQCGLFFLCGISALLLGCPSAPRPVGPPDPASSSPTSEAGHLETGASTPAAIQNPIPALKPVPTAATSPAPAPEPFEPPPLSEIEATAKWEAMPVEDGLELLRKYQADHPPSLTAESALSLKNSSTVLNEQIIEGAGALPKTDDEVDWDATFQRHTPMDINAVNPLLASSVADFDVGAWTGLSLFAFDWTLRPFASKEVVVSWESSEDRLYDKVVLRDDLTWSDGHPITAYDVAFSFQTIMNPEVPAVAVRSGTDELKGVHAYDDRTVIFFHKESLATNVWNINFPVIPKHIYESTVKADPSMTKIDAHVKLEAEPVTGGAFRLSKRVRGQEIVLERREDWYMHNGKQVRAKPYFKQVRLRILEDPNTAMQAVRSGKIDVLELNAEQWSAQTDDDEFYRVNTKVRATEWLYAYFGWNLKSDFFSDIRVRKAMSYSLDYEEMMTTLYRGQYERALGVFHPTAWMAANPLPEPYTQSLDKAEALLDEAGWVDSDNDGIRDKTINGKVVPFEFTLKYGIGSPVTAACELLAENLERIGVKCLLKPTEFTVLQDDAKKHNFDAVGARWGTGTDPDTMENLWTKKSLETGGRNYTSYINPEVDQLFADGKREFDRQKRALIYGKIHRILWDDQPYTWLFFNSSMYAFNKDLRGYKFSPRGPFHYSPGLSSIWKPKAK